MSTYSQFFTRFYEIDTRPAFSPNKEIAPENFKELVGEYQFDEDVICQVKGSNGICRQKHRKGWLGVTGDGCEVLIGGHCARNYFKADKTFALERKRVRKEIDRAKSLFKVKEYQNNAEELKQEIASLRQGVIETRVRLDQIYKTLPTSALQFLENAQRTNNWDLPVDIEQTYGDKQNSRWVATTLGRIKPLPFLYEALGLMVNVKDVAEAFDNICTLNLEDVSTPKLKRALDTLNQKAELEAKCEALRQDVMRFTEAKNIEMLIYTSDDFVGEFLMAKALMVITGAKVSSEGHINLRLRRIKEKFAAQLETTNIRKNQLIDRYQKSSVFSG